MAICSENWCFFRACISHHKRPRRPSPTITDLKCTASTRFFARPLSSRRSRAEALPALTEAELDGTIEAIPLPENSVDVIISKCRDQPLH
jgi:hypothetical protein